MVSDITAYALMVGAVVAALGAGFAALRVVFKAPKVVQDWLDARAAARVRHSRQERALDCLLAMQPDLQKVVQQLGPNGGQSMYDLVHQNDANLSELKAWVRDHRDHHDGIDENVSQWVSTLATMHQSLEGLRTELATVKKGG